MQNYIKFKKKSKVENSTLLKTVNLKTGIMYKGMINLKLLTTRIEHWTVD